MRTPHPAPLSPAAREAFRAQQVAAIPAWYCPWAHLLGPSLFGLVVIAAAVALLRQLRPWELLTVPVVFVLSNAAEWRIHRDWLHRRTRPVQLLYDRHTPIHHRIYITQDMAIRSRKEYRLVLLPAYAILLILLAVAPLTALLWVGLGARNVALLFLATSLSYALSYEWLHLCYHLPADSFWGRRRIIQVLRRHHAIHHGPERMQRWNFNVTVPLWDLVRHTLYRGPLPASREAGQHVPLDPARAGGP
ncbi:MAG: sterol desaturase family protein [Myxococcales bacterium]|nr:sterol desaturase family protein [Myxococcota bacterium]MDW8280239.1 sterol desaturase family protein [Myxococcales bacterium]